MKKTYTKPELYFESFELSANIATGCGIITKTLTENACGYIQPGVGVLFVDSSTGCDYQGADGDNSVCYHVPTSDVKLFTS